MKYGETGDMYYLFFYANFLYFHSYSLFFAGLREEQHFESRKIVGRKVLRKRFKEQHSQVTMLKYFIFKRFILFFLVIQTPL